MVRAKRSGTLAVAIGLIASAVIATSAQAVTRSEYIAQVDPICQAAAAAEEVARESAFKRFKPRGRPDFKQFLKTKGRALLRANTIFAQSIDQVAAVIPPPADAALLAQWLESVRVDLTLRGRLALAQKAGNDRLASKRFIPVAEHALQTNDLVASFGFRSCVVNAFP